MNERLSHFVYYYKNELGKIIYIGRGQSAARAVIHQSASHNRELANQIGKGKCTIHVAGPYEREDIASAVETALICCVPGTYNRVGGPTKWRFRPLGLPARLAERLDAKPITRAQRKRIEKEGAIYTYINGNVRMSDGRAYSPALEQGDMEVLERFDRWWSLRANATKWRADPGLSPRWLIGVWGPKQRRWVIGCAEIDHLGWADALARADQLEERRLQVPVKTSAGLDAHPLNIRGLVFDAEAAPAFTQQGLLVVHPR